MIDLDTLLVKPLEIYDGERGMVVLMKVRRKMDKLIEQHNKLVELLKLEEKRVPIKLTRIEQKWLDKFVNDPRDVIALLIQMRHTCQCVSEIVVWLTAGTYRHLWCKECNRPYLEKED